MSFRLGFNHLSFLKVLIFGLVFTVVLTGCESDDTKSESPAGQQSSQTINQVKESVADLKTREAELQRAMENPPVDLELVYELATVRAELAKDAYSRGEDALALDLLTNSLSIDPLDPDRWELLGDWSLDLKIADSLSMAHYAYTEAVDLRPDFPRTLRKLAAVKVTGGKFAEGISLYERALTTPQTINPEWAHLILLTQLYILAERTDQGMSFLYSQFDRTYDDRYLLCLAALMDGMAQSEEAAKIARSVAKREMIPDMLKEYAENLATRFETTGDQRLYGETRANQSWRSR